MLSILIPTYNYNCSKLLAALDRQAKILRDAACCGIFEYEIIVGDDASTDKTAEKANRQTAENIGARYIRASSNRGRAFTLNALSEKAKGTWLLIIDCDAQICSDTFLQQYWADRFKADVVCGALRNPEGPPPAGHELRHRYEQAAERRRKAGFRNTRPYTAFTTFNVMFRRDVFSRIRFDERCNEYGYEDALMGLTLEQNKISVLHTDNALIHDGIDSNESFLAKTEASLRTLSRLKGCMQKKAGTSKAVAFLQRLHLCKLAAGLFHISHGLLYRQLSGRKPSLFLFKLYKIGYYARLCCGKTDLHRP